MPPVGVDMPVYVTKDDAREAQRAESLFYGGIIPSGGMASQMQVSGKEEFCDDCIDEVCRVLQIKSTKHGGIVCSISINVHQSSLNDRKMTKKYTMEIEEHKTTRISSSVILFADMYEELEEA